MYIHVTASPWNPWFTLNNRRWGQSCLISPKLPCMLLPAVPQLTLSLLAAVEEEETAAEVESTCVGMAPWSLKKTLTLRLQTPSFTKMNLTKSFRTSWSWKVKCPQHLWWPILSPDDTSYFFCFIRSVSLRLKYQWTANKIVCLPCQYILF